MKRFLAALPLAALLLASIACDRPANRADDSPDAVAAADSHAAAAHAAADGAGQALLPIMQRLGAEMMTLTHALMTEDHATITRSAAAIAEHAPSSAAELERIHTTLGRDMATFEAMDESVHTASVRLHEAARALKIEVVAERLGEVQRGCVACHVQFRTRLKTSGGKS